jgi:hypothetical protein
MKSDSGCSGRRIAKNLSLVIALTIISDMKKPSGFSVIKALLRKI